MATCVAVSIFLLTATLAWSRPVPGSLDVHWNEGASDCRATPQAPLQVHQYEPQTFILRQSPCADFEANFIYLLIGSNKALFSDRQFRERFGREPADVHEAAAPTVAWARQHYATPHASPSAAGKDVAANCNPHGLS